ncbi:hypothetical protein ACIRD9_11670 [Streptomyces violaceus]|uniref:hypothetical protein n=1 Tax=Streptomyces violaceus TaxID=1936 RepID=UPI00382A2F4F
MTEHLRSPELRRAAHDMYCEMFLKGYRQSTSLPVERSTGFALVLYVVFISTFDVEFERARQQRDLLDYPSVLGTPPVAELWTALTEYLRAFRRDDEITGHVQSTFAAHYEDYRRYVTDTVARTDFGTTLKIARMDSGLTLRTIYEIIRRFNGHRPDQDCAEQFFALGMAGKFLDDMRDMVDDVSAGEPNLLYSLTASNERDLGVLQGALRQGRPITTWWWQEHCPNSLSEYFRHASGYYDRVTAADLRLPLDTLLSLLYSPRYWRKPIRRSPVIAQ